MEGGFRSSPYTMTQFLSLKDLEGRNVFTILLETKVYELLQVRVMH